MQIEKELIWKPVIWLVELIIGCTQYFGQFFYFNEQSILGYDSLQLLNILEEVSFIIDLIV